MPFPVYAWGVLGLNLFVIVWGALVRASGSGAGCGRHWPLCNGEVLPQSPATATLIEYTHRATSGISLLLVVVLFWWSRRAFPAGHLVRRSAAWALVFILTEAAVGAGLVLGNLVGDNDSMVRAGYLAVHLLNTFLLLAALALTAHWGGTTRGARRLESLPTDRSGAARWLMGVGLLLVPLVAVTGAIAALGDTLFPSPSLAEALRADASPTAHLLIRLRVVHPIAAVLTGAYLVTMVWLIGRRKPSLGDSGWSRTVIGLVILQLGIGVSNWLLLAPTPLQLAHLLVADLLWIALVIFASSSFAASPQVSVEPSIGGAAEVGGVGL